MQNWKPTAMNARTASTSSGTRPETFELQAMIEGLAKKYPQFTSQALGEAVLIAKWGAKEGECGLDFLRRVEQFLEKRSTAQS
ncbi:hypothetical protein GCM10023213_44480 [Prosthecobacter algae]|uniref:Uncharacterized protein n=1 Tax=Prosthecobacter algae TaxID=1144682 RepID=A0ABP9PMX2_9BACT